MSQNTETNYEQFSKILILGGTFVIIIGIFAHSFDSEVFGDILGQYGEFVGGVAGSLWTLAGVMLFYSALRKQTEEFKVQQVQLELQRKELELQRDELKLQREEAVLQRQEFERQTKQLESQNLTLEIQKFENLFFQLLRLQYEIISRNENSDYGKTWAKNLFDSFAESYRKKRTKLTEIDSVELIRSSYYRLPNRAEYLDRFYNNLYNIISFIEKSPIDEKQDYVSIVRSQLTEYELLILFYFSLTEVANEDFKFLIEKYSFMEYINDKKLIERSHYEIYNKTAFGKNFFTLS